jgi:hypothetical protein
VTSDSEPVIGAITAFRWFHVVGDQFRSIGLGDYLWTPGANRARCTRAGKAKTKTVWVNDPDDPSGITKTKEVRAWAHGRIPAWNCSCGFYVLRDEPILEDGDVSAGGSALCRVVIWGRAIQGSEGYRVEFAAITGLITTTPKRYEAMLNAYEILAVRPRTKAEQGLTTAYLRRVEGDRVHLDVIARDSVEVTGWFTVAPGVDIPDPIVEITARFTPERVITEIRVHDDDDDEDA